MTICYVLDDTLDKADGVQQCVVTIGEHLRTLGHDIHYLVAKTERTDIPGIHPLASFVSLRFNGNSVRTPIPTSRIKIREAIATINPDVVHIQMPYSPFFGARVIGAAPHKAKVVGTWHTFPTGGLQNLSHRPLYWMIRSSLRRVSVTIGVSKPTAEFADKIYRTNSIVIPNAVDIKRFIVKFTASTSGRKRLVFLGRFDERKGPLHLIRALIVMKHSGYDMDSIDIVMGGKGPLLERCKQLASHEGLSINFPGFIPEQDKPTFLGSADVTVFPSTGGEAFGISVVEAMASGNSIVLAGDNPGYRSILGDKQELLFDPRDHQNFAKKLVRYLNLRPEDAVGKKKWLANAAKQYDVDMVCEQLLAVYKS